MVKAAEIVYPSSQYNNVGPSLILFSISVLISSKLMFTGTSLLKESCK